MNEKNNNLDLSKSRQNILLKGYSFTYKSDYEEFYQQCRDIQHFYEIAPNLPDQKYVVQTLLDKINNNVPDKVVYRKNISLIFFFK